MNPYTVENYPYFVRPSGRNFGIWANARGQLASIPTKRGKRVGCVATHFGDWSYQRTLGQRHGR